LTFFKKFQAKLRFFPFWLQNPKSKYCSRKHDKTGSGSLYRKIISSKFFDRNTIWPNTVWPNAIWPKVHSTESPFNQTPFDRMFILPKGHMTDFFQKMIIWPNLLSTKNVIWPKKLHTRSFDRKFIWPKVQLFLKMIKFIWPKAFFDKWSFDELLVICHFGHLTSFQVIFSVKWPFSKKFRSNDFLINFVFGQMIFFGKMNFRSNGPRLNGNSVKCAFGQTVFGQMVFRSNAFRSKFFGELIFR
jgi:hypothetical protein